MVDPKACQECERGNPVDIYPDGTRLHVHGGGHAIDCTAVSPNTPEPHPRPSDGLKAWDLVIADMQERDCIGTTKYKQRLTCGDGRKSLVDAYQEALDLSVYLRKEIEERKSADAEISRLTAELASLRLAMEGARKALQSAIYYLEHRPDTCVLCEVECALALLSAPGEPGKLEAALTTFALKWRRFKAYERGTLGATELHPLQEAADALCALVPEGKR